MIRYEHDEDGNVIEIRTCECGEEFAPTTEDSYDCPGCRKVLISIGAY